MSVKFTDYQAVLLDLDGTLYSEEQALPGAAALVARLRAQGVRFACLSNSTASPGQVVRRLARMGMAVEAGQVYTAATAAVDMVLERYAPRPRVYNLATDGVQDMLEGRVDWVRAGGEACDAVIVGAPTNTHATEERQRVALALLRGGADLIGVCADRVYPSPRGMELGCGALAWMLGYAANVTPVFCGKPQRVFLDHLCARLGVEPAGCLLVGDNLEADIAMARTVGMRTILVLTGVARRDDLAAVAADASPHLVVDDLTALA